MAMVISVRSKVVTVALVSGFGLALILIIGSVLGWFDSDTRDYSGPSYGLHQRLDASNFSQVLVLLLLPFAETLEIGKEQGKQQM
jgi:hypothetical protein